MDQAQNTNQTPLNPSVAKVKNYGNRIMGEIFIGLILVVVPLAVGYFYLQNLNKTLIIWLLVPLFIGVCFLNLAYVRGISKSYFSWINKGAFLGIIARGIEWLVGLRD